MITMKYKAFSQSSFNQAFSKLANTETDGNSAYRISKLVKKVAAARYKVAEAYQKEMIEVFALRDADNKIIRPERDPHGFNVDPTKQEEFSKAEKQFDEREIEIEGSRLSPHDVRDMRASAVEVGALSILVDYENEDAGSIPTIGKRGKNNGPQQPA